MSLEKALFRIGLTNFNTSKLITMTTSFDNLKELVEHLVVGLSDHMDNTQKNFLERSD